MGSFYVTTGRKPSQNTRRLAKWLAIILGGESENRGHRSFDEIVERASAKGLRRIVFVYESHGNPSRIALWEDEWLEPEIVLKSVEFPEKEGRRLPGEFKVVAEDAAGEKIRKLLELEEAEGSAVELHASAKEIWFELDEKKVGPRLVLKRFGSNARD
ncbi:MAG: hypothetical protein AB1626_03800 [Candidatus Micrarchaeota archaeon]